MHRALELGDVLGSIFYFLCINNRRDFVALTALARTCCAFSDRALDLIWADAPLWYMAQRMDADLWSIKKETSTWGDDQRLCLTVSIEEALRRGLGARFDFYAERLRTYCLDTTIYDEDQWVDDNLIVDEDVMTCWAKLEYSFLGVRKLRLSLEALDQFKGPTMLPRFLARGQLFSLEVQLTQKPVLLDVITSLCGACTSIEELSTTGNYYHMEIEHTSNMLSYATGLRVVRMDMGLSYTHLIYLAKNRHLTRLRLSCFNVDALADMDNMPPLAKESFALRELIVVDNTSTALLVPTLLHACANTSLVICELRLDRAHTLLSIFQALAHHTHLRSLSIKGVRRYNGEITSAQVSPILNGLRNLEFLHLPYYITPHLPVALFTQTVQSLPQLRDWGMGDEQPYATAEPIPLTSTYCTLPLASFSALLEASTYVRQLPVIVSMQDTTSVRRRVPVSAEYTGVLRLIDVQDLEDTKQLVRELFPRVKYLYVHHQKGSKHVWSQVWPDNPTKKMRL